MHMLYFFSGTDRDKARAALRSVRQAQGKKSSIRISDANSIADLQFALQGSGMFGEKRVVVLEGILANEEMREVFMDQIAQLAKAPELYYVFEEKPDAHTRKTIEKHAIKSERFDLPKGKKDNGEIFALAAALRRGDKKALWVGYQRALAVASAPEAIHGILFWGAKQMVLSAREGSAEHRRGLDQVARLAELPHEARRRGFDLEYALEKYILGVNKS